MTYEKILEKLKSMANPKAVEEISHFGITSENTFGIFIVSLRKLANKE